MAEISTSRLVIPALGRIYRAAAPWTFLLVRLIAGLSFVPHGYPKLLDPVRSSLFFEKIGYRPSVIWTILVGLTEVVGGLMLAAGFLTRLACIPILVFLLNAIVFHSAYGFIWNGLGFEYPLFWTIVVLHFLVNGGGPYSIDAMLRKEI
jgi:putative oxidoreductase